MNSSCTTDPKLISNGTILGAHMNEYGVKPMHKKKGFYIRYHQVEGDLQSVISELVQEKVLSALNKSIYNPTIPFYDKHITVGDVNDAKSGNLCKGIK